MVMTVKDGDSRIRPIFAFLDQGVFDGEPACGTHPRYFVYIQLKAAHTILHMHALAFSSDWTMAWRRWRCWWWATRWALGPDSAYTGLPTIGLITVFPPDLLRSSVRQIFLVTYAL